MDRSQMCLSSPYVSIDELFNLLWRSRCFCQINRLVQKHIPSTRRYHLVTLCLCISSANHPLPPFHLCDLRFSTMSLSQLHPSNLRTIRVIRDDWETLVGSQIRSLSPHLAIAQVVQLAWWLPLLPPTQPPCPKTHPLHL